MNSVRSIVGCVRPLSKSHHRASTVDHFAASLEKFVATSTWLQKTRMTGFSKLVHLRHLDLSWNWLSHLEWLNSLTSLEFLSIKHGKYQGTLNLSALSQLRHLDVSENELTQFPDLPLGGKLTHIDASYNSLVCIPASIDQLLDLEEFNFSFNRFIVEVPAGLALLKKLRTLNMGGVVLSALPLEWTAPGSFPSLRFFSIQLTKFTEFPTTLFSLTSLTQLEVCNNKISSVPSGLLALSNLRALSLRYNDLTDLPSDLFALPNLDWLEICGNDLTSLSPRIGELSQLTYLDVSFNKLSSLPKEMSALKRLVHFHFHGNPLNDKSLADLASTSRTAAQVLSVLSGLPPSEYVENVDDSFNELPVVELPNQVKPVVLCTLQFRSCTSLGPLIDQDGL
jgi:Leucine-rich repeat (LRR) protein